MIVVSDDFSPLGFLISVLTSSRLASHNKYVWFHEPATLCCSLSHKSILQGMQSLESDWAKKKEPKGELHTLQLDVTNQKSVNDAKAFVMEVLQNKNAKLWGIVNNAGIFSTYGPDDWCSVDEYSTSLNVNTLGAVRMCHAFVPLIKQSKGRIVTMGSTAGRLHGLYVGPYVTAKFAVEGYMDCLRLEMRQYGVSVHILEPGAFKTELLSNDAQRMRIQKIWSNLSLDTKEEYGEDYRKNCESGKLHFISELCTFSRDCMGKWSERGCQP